MGVRQEHCDKIMENVSVLQQSYMAKGGPPPPPPNPPSSQFATEEGFCSGDPSIDPMVNPASSALISMSRNAMQRGRYRSGGSEDMGSSPGSSLGAPCPNSPMPPSMASPHSRLMSPPMASPHMPASSTAPLRSPAPSPMPPNMMQQQQSNMGGTGHSNMPSYQSPGPGPGGHFMGQQLQGYYGSNQSGMYMQQQQQRSYNMQSSYWGNEQYASYGNSMQQQPAQLQHPPQPQQHPPQPSQPPSQLQQPPSQLQQPPSQLQQPPSQLHQPPSQLQQPPPSQLQQPPPSQLQQPSQPQHPPPQPHQPSQPQQVSTLQMQQLQAQQVYPYSNNGMANGYIMGSALPPQLRNAQLQQPRENPQLVADSILQMASQQCHSNSPAVGPKLAPSAYNPQQHYEYSPSSPVSYGPVASSPSASCASSPSACSSLHSPPEQTSMPSPRTFSHPAAMQSPLAPTSQPSSTHFSYPSSSSTSCIAPSNPLMSLQMLVMRPESQVVDPKSVVSDSSCVDIPRLDDTFKSYARIAPSCVPSPVHEAPLEALQPSQPRCLAAADASESSENVDKKRKHKATQEDVTVAKKCRKNSPCKENDSCEPTKNELGDTMTASGPPASAPDDAVVVSPENPLLPLPPAAPSLLNSVAHASDATTSKKKKVKLKELKKRKHLGLELSKRELKRLKKEKKKNKKRKKMMKTAAAQAQHLEEEAKGVGEVVSSVSSPEAPVSDAEDCADDDGCLDSGETPVTDALQEEEELGELSKEESSFEEDPGIVEEKNEEENEEEEEEEEEVAENATERQQEDCSGEALKPRSEEEEAGSPVDSVKENCSEVTSAVKRPHRKVLNDSHTNTEVNGMQLLSLKHCLRDAIAKDSNQNIDLKLMQKDDEELKLLKPKLLADGDADLESQRTKLLELHATQLQTDCLVFPAARLGMPNHCHTVRRKDELKPQSSPEKRAPAEVILDNGMSEDDFQVVIAISSDDEQSNPCSKQEDQVIPMRLFKASPCHTLSEVQNPMKRTSSPKSSPASSKRLGRPKGSKNKPTTKAGVSKGKKRRRKDYSMDMDAFSDDDNIKDPRLKKTINSLKNARQRGKKEVRPALKAGPSGPYIKLRGPKACPSSCEVVNTEDYGGGSRRRKKTVDVTMLSAVKFEVSVPWTCAFCGRPTSDALLGELYGPYHPEPSSPMSPTRAFSPDRDKPVKVRRKSLGIQPLKRLVPPEIWVHEDCAVWTSGVHFSHGRMLGLDDAISAAKQTTCCVCKSNGASLGCLRKGCVLKYHFACAVEKECQLDDDNFSMVCPKHKRLAWNKRFHPSPDSDNMSSSLNSLL